MSSSLNNYDWLSLIIYKDCSYSKLSFDKKKVIIRTYRDRKIAIKATRALFKFSSTIREIGNSILKSRIKTKLTFEHRYRYLSGWWS